MTDDMKSNILLNDRLDFDILYACEVINAMIGAAKTEPGDSEKHSTTGAALR